MQHNRRAFVASLVGGIGILRARGLRSDQEAPGSPSLFRLHGSATEVGTQFGTLNRVDIRKHVSDVLTGWQKRGLRRQAAVAKSRPFVRFAEKFGPHWLDEASGCANSAGIPPDEYIAYLAGKYRSLFFTDDCTSFAAAGDATAGGGAIFHKNRDNARRAQSTYYKKIVDAKGTFGFFAVGDTSDMGLMMMVNDQGLAGSADMGGLAEIHPKGDGVMNPYILRLIAERAEKCEDALEIIKQSIRDGFYAGGKTSGTHWLFADRHGTILRVAQNSVEEKHWYHRDKIVFLARGQTQAAEAMQKSFGKLTIRHFHEAARSPDLCFGSSISALTVSMDANTAISRSAVWTALPAWAPSLPLFAAAGGVPTPIADGTCYDLGYRLLGPQRPERGFVNRRRVFQERLYEDADIFRRRQLQVGPQGHSVAEEASAISWNAWHRYHSWVRSSG